MVVSWCLLCLFSSCLLCLVLSLGNIEKNLETSPLHSPFRYLHTLMRSPVSLLFSRLKNPSSLSLFSRKLQGHNHFWEPSLGSLVCSCLTWTEKPWAMQRACVILMREFLTFFCVREGWMQQNAWSEATFKISISPTLNKFFLPVGLLWLTPRPAPSSNSLTPTPAGPRIEWEE